MSFFGITVLLKIHSELQQNSLSTNRNDSCFSMVIDTLYFEALL